MTRTANGAKERPLATYRRKRDFDRTPEPEGAAPEPSASRRFVVQRHRARRLHYDLRFEIDGVLVSWAVPKGPTLDPRARRLAVHVEDHPIEYIDFEGVIPEGEYGGGDVIVWDRGTWEPHGTDDPAKAVRDGELHAEVHGEKLSGRLVLIRRGDDDRDWLLLHKRDEHAVPGWDPEDHPESVKSGRTNDEVARRPRAAWRSDAPAAEAEIVLEHDRPAFEEPTPDELDALDGLGTSGTWDLQGRRLRLTNLDKVLYPPARRRRGVTKRDIIRYYATVAPTLLPYLVGRPLNTRRYPDGIETKGFWHKAAPSHAPEWITRWRNTDADPGETEEYIVADSVPTIAWLANSGALELHPWTSTADAPHQPSYALIDIDPGTSTTFDDTLVLARLYRTALDHLGVEGRPKVTGGRGVQIWIPIAPGPTFDDTRAWVESVSRAVGATVPELVSWRWTVVERGGLARLDYTQNAINKTLVAPYSLRARPGAPVSIPLEWDELDTPGLKPDGWTIRDVAARLAEAGDPFLAIVDLPQRLPAL
ncbi:MAG TPA: non-homologous end-joining DNA ligase [Ilumatobacteraceae bacterium]